MTIRRAPLAEVAWPQVMAQDLLQLRRGRERRACLTAHEQARVSNTPAGAASVWGETQAAKSRIPITVGVLMERSEGMREVVRRIDRAAQADCPVMIWGERGSGKQRIAETIHWKSRRSCGPLVVLRPEAGPEKRAPARLLEDELFGTSRQPGQLAAAAGGTLVIDEITGLPHTAQARLVKATERGDLLALNSPESLAKQQIDVRLMATTQFDLVESVRRGILREDVPYRLGVVTIHVPPLRERREDIPGLVGYLLTELCSAAGRPVPSLEPEFLQAVADHPWPGNVRQLRDCLARMMRENSSPVLTGSDLRSAIAEGGPNGLAPLPEHKVIPLAGLEREAVMQALEVHGGNRTRAAQSLGISVRTLQRRLARWQS